ncbi:MAG TPA: hypothetical protein VMQ11_03750, partial [Alphaproteobacteria bacterium]|nr:hypothetical protein [Alphaproteobacteria bacterium]
DCVFGNFAALCETQCKRLADVANHIVGDDRLSVWRKYRVGAAEWNSRYRTANVLCRHDGLDARYFKSVRYVDFSNSAVSNRASHYSGVPLPCTVQVADELTLAPKKTLIF